MVGSFCFQYWPRMTMTYQIIQAMFLFHSILQWGGLAPTFSNQWAWTLIYTIFGRKDKVSLEAMCEVTVQMNLKLPMPAPEEAVLLAMLQPEDTILQLLNAMSDRLACDDGLFNYLHLGDTCPLSRIYPKICQISRTCHECPGCMKASLTFWTLASAFYARTASSRYRKGFEISSMVALTRETCESFEGRSSTSTWCVAQKVWWHQLNAQTYSTTLCPFQHVFWCLATSYVCLSVRDPLKKSCGAELLSDLVTVQLRRRKPWQWPLNFWMIWF